MKNILFVASEGVPFIKTGGLADVVGSLPKCIDKQYFDVRVILPKYTCISQEMKDKMNFVTSFYMDFHWKNEYVGVLYAEVDGVKYYFIDNEMFFNGFKPYSDNALFEIEKYSFFSKAALSILPVIGFRPDIIHCHDWQDITGLPPYFFTPDKLELYKDANLLKGGLVYADAITTVSQTYAEEIKTEFYGEQLDGLMRARTNDLRGIVNGIDYEEFNPETDKYIEHHYNAVNFRKEKVKNKRALQAELGLCQDDKKFMIGIVSRLTDQKGFDLIAYMMDELCQDNVQLVVLGTGEERYENMFRHFDWKYNDKVSANIYYSEALSHKIYAASDAFLMPSLFEPCGLSQLMSLRYGTVPIVRETGGLKDTVEAYNEYESTGTGFSFVNYNAHEMLSTIRYAERIYYDRKREWNKIVDRAMAADFSWQVSASKYQEMYDWLIG